jgi:hypothetical protein
MAELILRLGNRLMVSRRKKCVRGSLLWLFSHLMVSAAVVFLIELIVILLGLGDVFLPLKHETFALLSRLFM